MHAGFPVVRSVANGPDPFVADRRNFLNRPNFTAISTIATIDRGPQIVTDRERLQHIPTEPGFGHWSQSPRFISTIRCDLSHFVRIWCDDHDWQVIVRRKFLNRPKLFYDQQDCHDWPQDLIRSFIMITPRFLVSW